MGFGKWFSAAKKIPVLAYDGESLHKSRDEARWAEQLSAQWRHLRDDGYQCLSLEEFLSIARAEKPAPDKALLLTFDGAAMLHSLIPLLENMAWNATLFVSAKGLSDFSGNLSGNEGAVIQIAMNGFDNEDYALLPLIDAKANLELMVEAFDRSGLDYHKVMAYPFGNIPKSRNDLILLKALLADAGVEAAFKIDDRRERVPSVDFYELSRIRISADDSPTQLKLMIEK